VTKYVSSIKINSVRSKILTSMSVKITMFSNVTLYSLVVIFRSFAGTNHTICRVDFFYYEYGDSRFLRYAVKLLPDYMTSKPRK